MTSHSLLVDSSIMFFLCCQIAVKYFFYRDTKSKIKTKLKDSVFMLIDKIYTQVIKEPLYFMFFNKNYTQIIKELLY